MTLSVIIVSFNTKKLLTDLLVSLKKAILVCENHAIKVATIIVDNNSSDGTVEFIKKHFSWVQIIANHKNLGYSKANNQAIKKTKSDYILLLNSDMILYPDTLYKSLKFIIDKPQAGAMTCRVELASGKIDPASHRGFPTPWNGFCYFSGLEKLFPKSKLFSGYHQGWKDLTKSHEIDACSGAFFLIKKKAIEKIGLLDEDFFMYGEDLDWAYRLKNSGFKIYYFPKAKIIHFKKRSGREKINDDPHSQQSLNLIKKKTSQSFFETMKLFYQKHYLNKYPPFVSKLTFWGIDTVSKFKH